MIAPLFGLLDDPVFLARLQEDLLPAYLPGCRWFRSKARRIGSVRLEARAPFGDGENPPVLAAFRVEFDRGLPERYLLPLALLAGERNDLPESAMIGSLSAPDGTVIRLYDACRDARFRDALFEALRGERPVPFGGGALRGKPAPSPLARDGGASRLLDGEQSNTSFSYAAGYFAKFYRRVEEGIHAEPEVLRFLREHTGYRNVPAFRSSLEWERAGSPPVTLALLQDFVPAKENAWQQALRRLENVRENPESSARSDLLGWVARLGTRVGELHRALGSRPDLPDFAAEPLSADDLGGIRAGTLAHLRSAAARLETPSGSDDPGPETENTRLTAAFLRRRPALEALLARAADAPTGLKFRTHGDLHLGQILADGEEIWILDFEGEPGRSLAEARRKQSPLRDVAGMLRSFDYAVHAAAFAAGSPADEGLSASLGNAFLGAYREASGRPDWTAAESRLLDLFVLEKAAYELDYELNNRPAWVGIPLRGLLSLCKEAS